MGREGWAGVPEIRYRSLGLRDDAEQTSGNRHTGNASRELRDVITRRRGGDVRGGGPSRRGRSCMGREGWAGVPSEEYQIFSLSGVEQTAEYRPGAPSVKAYPPGSH